MEFRLLALVFVSVAFVASDADQVAPEVYWYSMLPHTPMPKFIQDLLPALEIDHLGGVSPHLLGDIKGQLSSIFLNHNHNHDHDAASNFRHPLGNPKPPPYFFYHNHESASNLNGGGDQIREGKGQISSLLFYHGKYQNVTIFLVEKDLQPGVKMNFPFDYEDRVHGGAKVLTRQAAESIPFSSHKLSEILNLFSIKPETEEAQVMKTTIELCEEPAAENEDQYCATSLEGMVDFVASKLGKNVQAMTSTKEEADHDHKEKDEDGFLTISAVKMVADDNIPIVSCHDLNYAYPVFYCHGFRRGTRVYEVPLAATEGMVKAKATVVCHTNTSTWDPNHLSFHLLGVKRGTVPVCHFLPENNLLWAANVA